MSQLAVRPEKLRIGERVFQYYSLKSLEKEGYDVAKLPYSLRVLLENIMRNLDGRDVTLEHLEALARWSAKPTGRGGD